MILRHKKPRPLGREERAFRDDRLFVIATEDTYAPEQYFRSFRNPRIKVHVLPTDAGRSAPEHVMERLDQYLREYQRLADDEFWLMLDTDHWIRPGHVAGIGRVCAEARQKGYELANSNPCFEIWLLLHWTELQPSEQFATCNEVVQRFRDVRGTYDKCNLDPIDYAPELIQAAIERAKQLDESPDDRWPQKTGTRVYRVVERLVPGGS